MRKIITQHCTPEQQALLDLSRPINESYANSLGFEYVTNEVRRCPERSIYWEKIAYLREFLASLPDDTLVVWEDADSINIRLDSFEGALPAGGVFGMVQNRAGLGGSQLIPWFNAGVLVMVNAPIVRDFLYRVWERADPTDESAIVAELRHNGWAVGTGIPVSSIDCKWNRWPNNAHICANAVVQSWHGIPLSGKLPAMQEFIAAM